MHRAGTCCAFPKSRHTVYPHKTDTFLFHNKEWCAGGDAHEHLKEAKRKHRRGMITGGGVAGCVGAVPGLLNPPGTKVLSSGISEAQAVDWFTEILLGMKVRV